MAILKSVTVAKADAAKAPWAEGLQVSLPSVFTSTGDPGEILDEVRLARAFTDVQPTSSRLPFSYQSVPIGLRTIVGRAVGRLRRRQQGLWAAFPRFPIDLSADYLADMLGAVRSPFAEKTPVLLSHDLDTAEGLANAVGLFAPLEEKYGARSASYIVPCAWPIDHGHLSDLRRSGHEIGVHGYDHSNRTAYADASERKARLEAARPLIERYGIAGYRAPSLVRTRPLLKDLAGLYQYDSSIPTSGGLFPVPNNGCASARPFMVCGIWEIPISLPRDGSLRFLGFTPDEIFDVWRNTADLISCSGGVVSVLTHCEARFSGNRPMLKIYERFLNYLMESERFFFSSSREVLALARYDQT